MGYHSCGARGLYYSLGLCICVHYLCVRTETTWAFDARCSLLRLNTVSLELAKIVSITNQKGKCPEKQKKGLDGGGSPTIANR